MDTCRKNLFDMIIEDGRERVKDPLTGQLAQYNGILKDDKSCPKRSSRIVKFNSSFNNTYDAIHMGTSHILIKEEMKYLKYFLKENKKRYDKPIIMSESTVVKQESIADMNKRYTPIAELNKRWFEGFIKQMNDEAKAEFKRMIQTIDKAVSEE